VPHAGRAYTAGLLDAMRNPGFSALRLEDRYVDRLAEEVGKSTGATVLTAHAPRAMIDLNRAPDDIDWEMFHDRQVPAGSDAPGKRARTGLGLIPRRLPGIGELWKHRHADADLRQRVAGIHEPYHACLGEVLAQLRERWGAALLIDLHSMPPLPMRGRQAPARFVIGDRFGASCEGSLVGAAFSFFEEQGQASAHNRPYAGGYILERHARPDRGVHALQIEVDRSSYLDSRLADPGEGLDRVVELLSGLVRRLAAEVAAPGRLRGARDGGHSWPEAAE